MGWMVSWVAVQGAPTPTVLSSLGLMETGEWVDPGSRVADFSVREIDGWVVVFSEDFDWGAPAKALELSRLGRAVSLQFEDKIEMTAIACEAVNGVQAWLVSHVNDKGQELVVEGEPPPSFVPIRDEAIRRQREEGGADYLHDIPQDIAKAVCGYRADEEIRPFAALRPAGTASKQPEAAHEQEGNRSGGFFSVLKRWLIKY